MKIVRLFLSLMAVSPILGQNSTNTTTTKALIVMGSSFNATRDVSFLLYTSKNPLTATNLAQASVGSSNFNASNPTRVIIHGWLSTVDSPVDVLLKNAYLKRGNFNVICVNWDTGSSDIDYAVARKRIPSVADQVVKLLKFLVASNFVRLNDLILVGHSLGAHMSGLVGKQIPGIRAIVGLDPAEPLFSESVPQQRLASTDALYVQVVHTSTLGVQYNVGKADFYANEGLIQPGCLLDLSISCSHSRAYYYFAESIIGPNKFASATCKSSFFYFFGLCKTSSQYLFGGEPLNENLSGTFYFDVNSRPPYGQG